MRSFDDDPPPVRERPAGDLAGVPFGQTTAARRRGWAARLPGVDTPGRRRRWRRNLLILLGHRAGLSNRFLADAIGLSRVQVADVLAELSRLDPGPDPR